MEELKGSSLKSVCYRLLITHIFLGQVWFTEPILVDEFMPNGTLCEHFQRERGYALSWRKQINIAVKTAHALAYLYSTINSPIYYRRIKFYDFLLDYDFTSKVVDFGLSPLVMPENTHISIAP